MIIESRFDFGESRTPLLEELDIIFFVSQIWLVEGARIEVVCFLQAAIPFSSLGICGGKQQGYRGESFID